jgi:hypothetical protein
MHIGMKVLAVATSVALAAAPGGCEKRTNTDNPDEGNNQCKVLTRQLNSNGTMYMDLSCGGKRSVRSHVNPDAWRGCQPGTYWPGCKEG